MNLSVTRWRILILTIFFVCGVRGVAVAQTINLDTGFDRLTLGDGLEYIADKGAQRSLDQVVSAQDWQTWDRGSINFGFSNSAYWLRCTLVNTTQKELSVVLEVAFPLLQSVDLYIRNESGPPRKMLSGGFVPLEDRPMRHSLLLYPFELPANTHSELYLRIHSDSLLQLPIALSEQKAFVNYDHIRSLFFGSIYGLLAAMGLYHCLIYFSVRDKAYLHYGLFILTLFAGAFLLNGTAGSYLWPADPDLSLQIYLILMQVPIYFAMRFLCLVLNLANSRPRWHQIIGYVANAALLLMPLTLVIPIKLGTLLGLLLSNVAILVGFSIILIRIKDAYTPARYLLWACLFAAGGIFITISGNLTLIPTNFFTIHAIYIGLVAGAMLYAFALAYRINLQRAERDQAQSELIRIQRSTNERLDRLVQARTQELQKSNQRLQQISETDGLTQLFNRRYFDTIFNMEYQRAFRSQKPLSVLLLDIDHFKQVNDQYGHQFGDECLTTFAKIMRSNIRRPPDTAARYGGEEFVVLLPETDKKNAVRIAEMIRQEIAKHSFDYRGKKVRITASIGVCSKIPRSDERADAMLNNADQCLYRAKQSGRNRVIYQKETEFTLAP